MKEAKEKKGIIFSLKLSGNHRPRLFTQNSDKIQTWGMREEEGGIRRTKKGKDKVILTQ